MVPIICPRCKSSRKIPDEYAGKTIKCPDCNKPIHIPVPKASPDVDPSQKIDAESMQAIEQGGEALERRRSRWQRKMTLKEAQKAAGESGEFTRKPQDPNIRICAVCGTEVRVPDPYVEALCLECDSPIPALIRGGGESARYSDSLAGRMTTSVSFYTGFTTALLYPVPALMWILLGMGLALAIIVVPVGAVLAFFAGSQLNPITAQTDFTWVGLVVTALFVIEALYFVLVDYHILIDTIRTTSAGLEAPPALAWSPASLGTALLGYISLAVYYVVLLGGFIWLSSPGGFDLSSVDAFAARLRSPGNFLVLALLTFMVPMQLIGLASGRSLDGLNPVRVFRSIVAVAGHYCFLFLIVLMYLGILLGVTVGVMDWAGGAIVKAARTGIQQGLAPMGMGLLAWAAVIGLGFFISYSLGRVLGLFARTFKDKLDFDL